MVYKGNLISLQVEREMEEDRRKTAKSSFLSPYIIHCQLPSILSAIFLMTGWYTRTPSANRISTVIE